MKVAVPEPPVWLTGEDVGIDVGGINGEGKIEPSEQEQQILDLHQQGESVSAIAIAVFGSKGGNYNAKVKEIIAKFG